MASSADRMHAGLLEITKLVKQKRSRVPTAEQRPKDAEAVEFWARTRVALFQALYLASVPAFSGGILWILENVIMFAQVQ